MIFEKVAWLELVLFQKVGKLELGLFSKRLKVRARFVTKEVGKIELEFFCQKSWKVRVRSMIRSPPSLSSLPVAQLGPTAFAMLSESRRVGRVSHAQLLASFCSPSLA